MMKREELMSRVEVRLRRKEGRAPAPPALEVGALVIRTEPRTATWRGRQLTLSPKEFDLLLLLENHSGEALSRTYLFDHLWADDFAGEARLIDTHIMKLRRRLKDGAYLIETVWGTGYRLLGGEKLSVAEPGKG